MQQARLILNQGVPILLLIIMLSGCNMAAAPTATTTPTPTTEPSATATVTATVTPTATATATASTTPTATATPTVTTTPSITPTASITPHPPTIFRADQLDVLTLPDFLNDGIDNPQIIFANNNDQQSIGNIATAQPENTTQTVYITAPGSRNRTALFDIPSSDNNRFFLAPNGASLAYFMPNGSSPGLYMVNITGQPPFRARVWATTTLTQRGITSAPTWLPDGSGLAVTQQTGYALDIYLYGADGSTPVNITQHPAYDMWPSFSPDGRYMAFVSDRGECPSWTPGDPDFCDALTRDTPTGGTVHLLDRREGTVRQLVDIFVSEAPRWIDDNLLVIAGGDQNDLLNPQRTLWLANISNDTIRQVRLTSDDDTVQYLADAWAPDGRAVIVQRATSTDTEIVMMTVTGEVVQRRSATLSFPRFGVAMDWSIIGNRVAIGGLGGRCPYGVRVADDEFDWVATGNQPSICNPQFSPDGNSLVFTGVTSEVDGRLDIYSATADGFGAINLTGDLRGTNTLIGWVGPR